MRINNNFDSYNIGSLETIVSTVSEIEKQCEVLEQCGIFIKSKVTASSDEFTSINYERIDNAADDYIKRLRIIRGELLELVKSCKDFEEKIRGIWS